MIPVLQTSFEPSPDDPQTAGNCWSACIASILEIPIEEVPTFAAFEDWWQRSLAWLEERGKTVEWIRPSLVRGMGFSLSDSEVFYVITGKSPRGDWNHSVVGHRGEIAHDPHPTGDGIESALEYAFIYDLEVTP